MNCHSQIWSQAPTLEPVRESWRTGQPIDWVKVHDLPDFVYFDHSVHVNKGVGCSTCHGRVDEMAYVWQEESLLMEWCLECHRQPEKFLRPKDEVYNIAYEAPANQLELGRQLVEGIRRQPAGHLLHVSPMSQDHIPAVPVELETLGRRPGGPGRRATGRASRSSPTARASGSSCSGSSPSRPRPSMTRRAAGSSSP